MKPTTPSGREPGAAPSPPPRLPTEYLPAERETPEQIEEHAERVKHSPIVERILETVPEPIVILGPLRQIVLANQAFVKLSGHRTQADVLGKRPGEALACVNSPKAVGGCGTSTFCRYCQAARVIQRGLQGVAGEEECTIMRVEGEALDLRVYSRALQIQGHAYVAFCMVNLSDEKRRRVLERLFFHDVMNTVCGLTGLAEMLEAAVPAGSEAHEYARGVLELAERIGEEVNAQRQLLAAESGELQLLVRTFDGAALFAEVASSFQGSGFGGRRRLQVHDDGQDATMCTDATLLRRILSNMVKNALEETSMREPVTLRWMRDGDRVVFSVHNPGVMTEDVQMQVFKRSFSTKGAGRGLGTYSMRLLGERYLRGRVWFDSSEARGTTFFVSVPVSLDPPPAPPDAPGWGCGILAAPEGSQP